MASLTVKQPCVKCKKPAGFAVCGGCQQWFCAKHFNEHRQELALRMDHIGQQHDLLQADLVQDDGSHPFFSRINQWEQTSIKKIEDAANTARNDLRKYLEQTKHGLKASLSQLTKDLQSNRESNDYTEMDLNEWIKQLEELRKMIEKSSTIELVDDCQTQPVIGLIQ